MTSIDKLPFFAPIVMRSSLNSELTALKSLLTAVGAEARTKYLLAASDYVDSKTYPDNIIQIAPLFGFAAEHTRHPRDHLLLKQNLPALAVIRQSEHKSPRVVLVWNRIGPFIQLMDPRRGRRWLTEKNLLEELYSPPVHISTEEWLTEAASWRSSLQERLLSLKLEPAFVTTMLNEAISEWYRWAALDAATRMASQMIKAGGFKRGAEAKALLSRLYSQTLAETAGQNQTIPTIHWSVLPQATPDGKQKLLFRDGISLVQLIGKLEQVPVPSESASEDKVDTPKPKSSKPKEPARKKQTVDLFAFLAEDGLLTPSIIAGATALSAMTIFFQTILFRGLMKAGLYLNTETQRIGAIALLLVFTVLSLILTLLLSNGYAHLGRSLDIRIRLMVLNVIPKLSPLYLQQFSAADITERIHSVRGVHFVPNIGGQIILSAIQLLLTVVGIAWIDLLSAPLAILRVYLTLTIASSFRPFLTTQQLRLRSYLGILSRFYLDAMQGLIAIRTHGAERAVRREHENAVVKWAESNINLQNAQLLVTAVNMIISTGLVILILIIYMVREGDPANLLLLFFWTLDMDTTSTTLMFMVFGYIREHSKAARFLDFLNAPREDELYPKSQSTEAVTAESEVGESSESTAETELGIEITMKNISIEVAKRMIITDVNLKIEAGSHIAIVGPSGAGKSTFVGLLLGWYPPVTGEVLIDGQPLTKSRLQRLRHETAWVEPTVQLWNDTFLYNLRYGGEDELPLNIVIKQADLRGVLRRLSLGLQTRLGEGGGLVSGGEGQRTRFGRAMQRQKARLTILDEPFRGLDRDKRRLLLSRARDFWKNSTLICVTHDVGQTLTFDRVLVVDRNKIIEDGNPQLLMAQPNSRFRALLDAEETVREKLWGGKHWRRLWLENGKLNEKKP